MAETWSAKKAVCLTCRKSMSAADRAPDPMTHLTIVCSCGSLGHVVRFTHDPIDDQIFVDVTLDPECRWWQRALAALRYVFRPHALCGFHGVSEVIVEPADRAKLREWVNALPFNGGT